MPPMAESKCTVVVSASLPTGHAANAASVIAMTLARRVDGLVGPDVKDADQNLHTGIVLIPVPILVASHEQLKTVRAEATADPQAVCVSFTSLAQSCRTYDEYVRRMAESPATSLEFVALGLFGPKRLINKLTGSLPLLR